MEMKKNELSNPQDGRLSALFEKVSNIIEQSRRLVYDTANVAEVKARYEVGLCRLFYQLYANPQIEATVLRKLQNAEKQEVFNENNPEN